MKIFGCILPDRTWWDIFRRGPHKGWLPGPIRGWMKSLFWNSPLGYWIARLWPSRGTLSVLFGVHQFLWHPWTVARAWRHLYGKWPTWVQWIAIFCHDLGYWGKQSMDGPDGRTHPVAGANLACWLVYYIGLVVYRNESDAMLMSESVRELCLWHSTHYAQMQGGIVSELYLPDKVCVLFDPKWFYLLRGRISGEVHEYFHNENLKRFDACDADSRFQTEEEWLTGYRGNIRKKAETYFAQCQLDALRFHRLEQHRILTERRHALPSA